MAAKKDINGMRAQNWKKADTAGIQAVSVKSKNDNVELFAAVKEAISEAVRVVRGDASDDRYRYIVDLIMMRVRGALSDELIAQLELSDEDIVGKLTEKIDEAAKQIVEERGKNGEDGEDGEDGGATTKTDAKELADLIVEKLSEEPSEAQNAETDGAKRGKTIENRAEPASEPDYGRTKTKENERTPSTEKTAVVSVKLLDETGEKIENMQKLVTQLLVAQSKPAETAAAAEKKPSNSAKAAVGAMNKLDKIASKPVVSADNKAAQKKSEQKKLQQIRYMIDKKLNIIPVQIESIIKTQNKQLDKMQKTIEDIEKATMKSGISMTDILMALGIIGSILVATFWDKIKAWLTSFDLVKIILEFLPTAETIWEWLKTSLSGLGEIALNLCKEFIANPLDFVVKKFKKAYEAITEWTSDVWNWITGKNKENAEKRDESEKRLEEKAKTTLDKNFGDLNKKIEDGITEQQKTLEKHNSDVETKITDAEKKSEEATREIQKNTETQITGVTNETNKNVEEINQETTTAVTNVESSAKNIETNVLPGAEKNLDENVNKSVDNIEKKTDNKIAESEKNAQAELDKIEEKAKAEGAGTDVTNKSLQKLEQNAGGADLGESIDSRTKTPDSIGATEMENDGKNIKVFADKGEISQAQNDAAGVTEIKNSVYTVNNKKIDNMQMRVSLTSQEAKLEQGGDLRKEYIDIIQHSATLEQKIDDEGNLLKKMRETIEKYFTELNEFAEKCVDAIPKADGEQTTQNNDNFIMMFAGAPGQNNRIAGENR